MKYRGRVFWAVVMTALAVAALAGFTAASRGEPGAAAVPSGPPQAPTAAGEALVPAALTPPETPEDALLVTVRDAQGVKGRTFTLSDGEGNPIRRVALNRQRECVLELSPGRSYALTARDGQTVGFFLEENASISNVTGDGWTDGELLHIDRERRCSLRVVRSMPDEAVVYTLTGNNFRADRTLRRTGDEARGSAVFSGLLPGVYRLSGTDGAVRTIRLTAQTPHQIIGLD